MKGDKKLLGGVEGWLLWFALIFAVIAPLRTMAGLLGTHPSSLTVSYSIVGAAFNVMVGILIFRRNPLGIQLARLILLMEFVAGAILMLAGNSNSLAPFVGSVIWLAYTYKSQRVALTFPTLKSSIKLTQSGFAQPQKVVV